MTVRCLGGSWDGRDITLGEGETWLQVASRAPTSLVSCNPDCPYSPVTVETYRLITLQDRTAAGRASFLLISNLTEVEGIQRLLRLYRPPQRVNEMGEEQYPPMPKDG